MTEVAAALIEKDGRFLIARRPANKSNALLWEFPGGKKEAGETLDEALMRECREELDAAVSVGEVFFETVHEYPDITVHLTLFRCRLISNDVTCVEHAEMAWVTASELDSYTFCPADKEILEKLRREYR